MPVYRVRITVLAVPLFFAFALAVLPAQAQTSGAKPTPAMLAAQIKDLADRIAKLEGNITASDLVGTYHVFQIDTALSGGGAPPHPPATIATFAAEFSITFNWDGAASASAINCSGNVLTQSAWSMTHLDCGLPPITGTWSYADGVAHISIEQFEADFSVALGGRLLTTAIGPFHASDPSSDNVLVIASRLH